MSTPYQDDAAKKAAYVAGFQDGIGYLIMDILLREGPTGPTAVHQQTGISTADLFGAFRRLKEAGKIYEMQDKPIGAPGYYWYAPVIGENAEIPGEPENDQITDDLLETIEALS